MTDTMVAPENMEKVTELNIEDAATTVSSPYSVRINEAQTALLLNSEGEIVGLGFIESREPVRLTSVKAVGKNAEKMEFKAFIMNRSEQDMVLTSILRQYSPTYQSMGDLIGDLLALPDKKILQVIKVFKQKFFAAFDLDHEEVMEESEANPDNHK